MRNKSTQMSMTNAANAEPKGRENEEALTALRSAAECRKRIREAAMPKKMSSLGIAAPAARTSNEPAVLNTSTTAAENSMASVSYTHLDVYKRQTKI